VVKKFDRVVAMTLDGGSQVILTREGMRLFTERVRYLRVEVLPDLSAALGDRERDGRVEAHYEQAVNELRLLTRLIDHAAIAEDEPDAPGVVELGKAVTVQDGQGVIQRFLIVHPVEAPLDDTRISIRSPLAQALLGHRVGEGVEVAAPTGPYRCRILAAERLGSHGGDATGERRAEHVLRNVATQR
jgi:transcription elongation factor GreA